MQARRHRQLYAIGVQSFRWVTVVETPVFLARAKSRLTDGEREALVRFVARYPTAGAVIEGTGGVRKVRFAAGERGKRGSVRVVYYYRNEAMPVFLLSVYSKNEHATVPEAQRRELTRLVRLLCAEYGVDHDAG